jgi:glycosyltransferase involved in cell wall biosynthesis
MKILIAAADAPPYRGGISRLAGLLKDGLGHLGHDVVVANPNFRVGELKFSAIPFYRYSEFDLLHVHGPTPFLSDLMLLLHSKWKMVYTHHAEISYGVENVSKAYRYLHRILAKKAEAIIVHSLDYARLFSAYNNVTVVRPPCMFSRGTENCDIGSKASPFTVLFVGQLRSFKGVELLVKAASRLKNIRFIIVGNGYLRTRLLRLAGELRLKNIDFFSNVNDDELMNFYMQAHVVCLPSVNTTEAWGLVLNEGAFFGCVPLASNLIGVRENVELLKGITFRAKSCTDLVEKIETLSKDMDLWEKSSKRCRGAAIEYGKVFSSDYYVRKHVEVFSRVVGQNT